MNQQIGLINRSRNPFGIRADRSWGRTWPLAGLFQGCIGWLVRRPLRFGVSSSFARFVMCRHVTPGLTQPRTRFTPRVDRFLPYQPPRHRAMPRRNARGWAATHAATDSQKNPIANPKPSFSQVLDRDKGQIYQTPFAFAERRS